MGTETCLHCWREMAERGRCDECGEPACTGCIERSAGCSGSTLPQIEDLVDFLAYTDDAPLATLRRLATERLAWSDPYLAAESPPEATFEAATLAEIGAHARSEARRRLETLRSRLRRLTERARARGAGPARSACLAVGELLAQEPSEADDFLAFRRDDVYGDHMERLDRWRGCEDCDEFPRVDFDRFTWLQQRIMMVTEPHLYAKDADGARIVDAVSSAEEVEAADALFDMYGFADMPVTDCYAYLVTAVSKRLRKIGLWAFGSAADCLAADPAA